MHLKIIKPKIKKDPNSYSHKIIFQNSAIENDPFERAATVTNFAISGDLQEVEDKIKSLMSKSDKKVPNGSNMTRATVCTVCGKEDTLTHIKEHIEVNHLEGVSIPCNSCEKTFRYRN